MNISTPEELEEKSKKVNLSNNIKEQIGDIVIQQKVDEKPVIKKIELVQKKNYLPVSAKSLHQTVKYNLATAVAKFEEAKLPTSAKTDLNIVVEEKENVLPVKTDQNVKLIDLDSDNMNGLSFDHDGVSNGGKDNLPDLPDGPLRIGATVSSREDIGAFREELAKLIEKEKDKKTEVGGDTQIIEDSTAKVEEKSQSADVTNQLESKPIANPEVVKVNPVESESNQIKPANTSNIDSMQKAQFEQKAQFWEETNKTNARELAVKLDTSHPDVKSSRDKKALIVILIIVVLLILGLFAYFLAWPFVQTLLDK